jgi:small subunit ribosomal protein S6
VGRGVARRVAAGCAEAPAGGAVAAGGASAGAAGVGAGGADGAGAGLAAPGSAGCEGAIRGQATTRAVAATAATAHATLAHLIRWRSGAPGSGVGTGMPVRGVERAKLAPVAKVRRRVTPVYDLMLMLEPTTPDERRAQIVADAEAAITAQGSLVSKHDWGVRALAYEINHRAEADYHLLQFTGPRDLLESLQRSLTLADGVVRFRIIKLAPGTPDPPTVRPEPPRVAEAPREEPAADAEAPDAAETAAVAEAEPEAAPEGDAAAPAEPEAQVSPAAESEDAAPAEPAPAE